MLRGMPEFSELVLACRHRLILALLLGAVVSIGLLTVAFRTTKASYKAESLIRVRQHQEVVFTPQTSRVEDADFVRAQEQRVLSPEVLATVLRDEQILALSDYIPTEDAVEWLQDLLRVDLQAGAEVMHISVQHPSPQVAQALCNATTRAYLTETNRRLQTDRERKRQELERAAREADEQLDDLWAELHRVAADVGSDSSESLTIRDEIQLQAYREYAQQLRRAQLKGNELQSLLTDEQLRLADDNTSIDAAVEERVQRHPTVVAANNRIGEVDVRIEQMREIAVDDESPKLQQLYDERAALETEAEKVMVSLRPQFREQLLDQRKASIESSIRQLEQQIELNQTEKQFLHARMEEIDTTIVRSDDKNGVQLEMARHAVDRQTRLADALSRSLEEFKIECQSAPRVTLLAWAELPRRANRSRQLKAGISAVGLGWLFTVLSVGLLEWRSCRIRSGLDVKSRSAHPVFGANGNGFARGAQEAAVRLMLQQSDDHTVPTLMVSSAVTGEPRHLVSLELACAFQSLHCRTLLIDCDTSRTSLGRKLKAERLPGMIQLSTDSTDPRQYIVSTDADGLDYLPLGQRQEPRAWVDPKSLRRALKTLRHEYEAVVVNGPAVMTSAECLLLASQVDQTVFAVFQESSRWNQLLACEEVAAESGITVLGTVLHSGQRSASLRLKHERRAKPNRVGRSDAEAEESLRASVANMQHELSQSAASSGTAEPTETASNREFTS